jgi:beta-galactosidase/beta-glucuronidase
MEHVYPRPLLRRNNWESLNGEWDFAMDPDRNWKTPQVVTWSHRIRVPFAPETPLSGVDYRGFCETFWYRTAFTAKDLLRRCLILHFGAVDYRATVWVNGNEVMIHEGGYTPFSCDITSYLNHSDSQELILRAEDDPGDLGKPRGKQDWQLNPHSIWYPRTSGIWRIVWTERVPPTHIASILWTPSTERWEVGLEVHIENQREEMLQLELTLSVGDIVLARDRYSVIKGEVYRRISLSDPGIDDYRNELLWRPERPTLIDADLKLLDCEGRVIDEVESYTALRSIGLQGNRFVLNGRPVRLQMVLDQGYWPESGLTPPNDDALRKDVELTKAMGFNGVRKHQKIEDPRYLFWADKLGLLVWEEMPSAYRYTHPSIRRVTREWLAVLERDLSHPCIVAWVPFNESWGVPDLPDSHQQRHYVRALYHLTKTMDPTRIVIGNDGWESVATDVIGIHDYDANPERIAKRYGDNHDDSRLLRDETPGGRLLVLAESANSDQPLILSEFGGIAFSANEESTWGYSRCRTPKELLQQYRQLITAIRASPLLAGYCYTQFADTYQETNGLLYADRTPKIPITDIAAVNLELMPENEERTDSFWRARLMDLQRHLVKLAEEPIR